MDEQKVRDAIKFISEMATIAKAYYEANRLDEHKKRYEELNTVIETLKKQIPKKVDAKEDYRDFNGMLLYYKGFCPDCGFVVQSNKNKCCSFCAQMLDWTK